MDIIGQKRVHTQNAADVAGRGFVHEKKKGLFSNAVIWRGFVHEGKKRVIL